MENIPDDFIERQLNDSRYISKVIKGLLSNIVRKKVDDENYESEAISKNLISCNGKITDRLKKEWGMNDVWNSIILPRFVRMNQITGKDCFTTTNAEGHVIPNMPLELQKGFNKKRIDHRHHAMDAIVIACTTRDHVNLLNNEAAHSKYNANRYQLQRKLRRFEKTIIDGKEREVAKEFLKPWESFSSDAKNILENIVVSFKQNQRVINKTTNTYQHFDENGKKVFVKQVKGDSWAIRKPMHKATIYGEVNLQGKGLKKCEKRFFATRFGNDLISIFSGVTNGEKAKQIIKKITDTGIQKILLNHLKTKNTFSKNGEIIEHPEIAFSPDGIDELNKNIVKLNNGKYHQPIFKVRIKEAASKFNIGEKGNKQSKFVEAADGTNLFFCIFENENKERTFLTLPLRFVINCQKKYRNKWRQNIILYLKENKLIKENLKLQFILSPNDFVYLPTKEQLEEGVKNIDRKRLFVVNDFNDATIYFRPHAFSKAIFEKEIDMRYDAKKKKVLGSFSQKTANYDDMSIKDVCLPIKVDRLGNIIELDCIS